MRRAQSDNSEEHEKKKKENPWTSLFQRYESLAAVTSRGKAWTILDEPESFQRLRVSKNFTSRCSADKVRME